MKLYENNLNAFKKKRIKGKLKKFNEEKAKWILSLTRLTQWIF